MSLREKDTYLAAPNGLDLDVAFVFAVAFAILGDERGEDAPEGAPDRGRSSSFRRPI